MTDTSSTKHHLPHRYAENGDAFPGWPGHGGTAQSIRTPLQPPQDCAEEPNASVRDASLGPAPSGPENRPERRKSKRSTAGS